MRDAFVSWTKRLLACGVIVGGLAYIPYRLYGSEGWVAYRMLEKQCDELERRNLAMARENADLSREVKRLRDDRRAIEAVARDELGMIRPGEIVVVTP